MSSQLKILVPGDTHVVDLVGQRDELLKLIEESFSSDILVRGNEITITGPPQEAEKVAFVFEELLTLLRKGHVLTTDSVGRAVQMVKGDGELKPSEVMGDPILVTRGRAIRPKTSGQKRYTDAILKNTLVFAIGPAGTGKCVGGSSLVLSDRGMTEIQSLAGERPAGSYEPLWLSVNGLDGTEPASHLYYGGETETVCLWTRFGYSIETTPEHPLLVLAEDGELRWRPAAIIEPGQIVVLQRGQRLFGSRTKIDFRYEASSPMDRSKPVCIDELDEDFAYVMGLLTGDGCLSFRNRVILSSADAPVHEAFARFADRLGLHVFPNGGDRPYDRIIASSQLYALLCHLGMSSGTARTKRVPRSILQAPERIVAAFLRGLFDADGTVDARDGRVELSSVSEALIQEVQTILLNLGIVSARAIKRGRYQGRRHFSHRLSIYGVEAEGFGGLVGWGLVRKGALVGQQRERNPNFDVVPNVRVLLGEAVRTTRLPRAEHRLFTDYRSGRRRPSHAKLSQLLDVLDARGASGASLQTLRLLNDPSLLFLNVEHIQASRATVYDLTVPGTHSFVANGFVNHNTYLAVAMAVKALREKEVSRIILTRPAVEAGERLGFLPGDIAQKVDPYLKPLYDALYEMLEPDHFARLMERATIEVAPLAFMRGRAQPYFSKVLTPTGFKPIGGINVGDLVIGSEGRPIRVLGVYRRGRREVFRVRAQDGASTLCCGEHLWAVRTPEDRRRAKPARVVETQEMAGHLRSWHNHRFELPLMRAVEFEGQDVPMDPYALGLLLGEGCLTGSMTPSLSTTDAELATALEAALDGIEVFPQRPGDYVLRREGGGGRGGVIVANPVTALLRELGLCGASSSTKFVPPMYLRNTAAVRLALLQGLLDTDGGPVTQAGRSCRIQYTTTSIQLRDDVVFLVRSLGGVAYWRTRPAAGRRPGRANGRDVHHRTDAYTFDIRLPQGVRPFRLRRKLDLYQRDGGGRPMRFIDSIERAGEEETLCIRVDAPDSLYVTDDFLLTHNSLNDSFIILDEAQNTTPEQMKMFLTRLGLRSKAVVTGDITQIDLPEGVVSGLRVVDQILRGIKGLEFVHLEAVDVVRHSIVQQIVEAYRRFDEARRAADTR